MINDKVVTAIVVLLDLNPVVDEERAPLYWPRHIWRLWKQNGQSSVDTLLQISREFLGDDLDLAINKPDEVLMQKPVEVAACS